MDDTVTTLRWLPTDGAPQQLFLLFHGVGANAADLAPLAEQLHQAFPQAAVLAFDGFEPFDGIPGGGAGRQWFSILGVSDANRAQRVAAVMPALSDLVRAAQQVTGVDPQATALVGFSQGAICALELAQTHDGLAGRVLAFAGRYATLPTLAPRMTTLHFFHGADDEVIPVQHARQAIERLAAIGGDATIDIASGVGHEIDAHLLRSALLRLTRHIPARTWAQAMGAAPGQPGADDDERED
jgi:phospholipase/carboxylesterase